VSKPLISDFAIGERYLGYSSYSWMIFLYISSLFSEKYGGKPVSISNKRAPSE
jgi:hypothetical protein